MGLELQCASEPPGGLAKSIAESCPKISDSEGLGQGHINLLFTDEGEDIGGGATLGESGY